MIAFKQGYKHFQKSFKGLLGKSVKEVKELLSAEVGNVEFALFNENDKDKDMLEFYFGKILIVKRGNKVVEDPSLEGQEPDLSKCSYLDGTSYETAEKNIKKCFPQLKVVNFLKGSKPPKTNGEHVLIEVDENNNVVNPPVYKMA